MKYFYAIFAFVIVATVSIMGLRGTKTNKPPLEIFPDMDRQAKVKAQTPDDFFANGTSERPVPANTVAFIPFSQQVFPQTQPKDAFVPTKYMETGKIGPGDQDYGNGIPYEVTQEFMELGQEKYGIYCSVCHSPKGDGNGVTKSFGLALTPSYHSPVYRDRADGHIYETITLGRNNGNMMPYGPKLTIRERWAVVAYVRALQRAENATLEDIPLDKRKELGL